MNWKTETWLAIDCETTGADTDSDVVVELGAILFDPCQGKVLKRMGMLLNPGRPIPEDATKIHGIGDDDVKDQPTLAQVQNRFLGHVHRAAVLVGYNWPFDAAILKRQIGAQDWNFAIADKPVIDPLVVVRFDDVGRMWKGKGRHRLTNVARRMGITIPEGKGRAHRATTDAILTCLVLRKIVQFLPNDGAEAHRTIIERRREQDADFQAWLAKQKKKEG